MQTRPITASWPWTKRAREVAIRIIWKLRDPSSTANLSRVLFPARPYRYQVKAVRSIGDLTRRDGAKPGPGTKFWKIEPLKFSLIEKPSWMSINPETGLITGTPDGKGGSVIISVTLTKERRLVHDENAIVWGNEYEKSKT